MNESKWPTVSHAVTNGSNCTTSWHIVGLTMGSTGRNPGGPLALSSLLYKNFGYVADWPGQVGCWPTMVGYYICPDVIPANNF